MIPICGLPHAGTQVHRVLRWQSGSDKDDAGRWLSRTPPRLIVQPGNTARETKLYGHLQRSRHGVFRQQVSSSCHCSEGGVCRERCRESRNTGQLCVVRMSCCLSSCASQAWHRFHPAVQREQVPGSFWPQVFNLDAN